MSRATLRRVWSFARPYRRLIGIFLALILVAALLALVPPFVVRAILDDAIPSGDRALVVWLAAAALVLGGFMRLEAAVACLGAGGGLRSPGTKSRMGRIFSSTPLRSASILPSSSGIQVPWYLP